MAFHRTSPRARRHGLRPGAPSARTPTAGAAPEGADVGDSGDVDAVLAAQEAELGWLIAAVADVPADRDAAEVAVAAALAEFDRLHRRPRQRRGVPARSGHGRHLRGRVLRSGAALVAAAAAVVFVVTPGVRDGGVTGGGPHDEMVFELSVPDVGPVGPAETHARDVDQSAGGFDGEADTATANRPSDVAAAGANGVEAVETMAATAVGEHADVAASGAAPADGAVMVVCRVVEQLSRMLPLNLPQICMDS